MTGMVSYTDIALAMGRSPSVVKSWASLSRPKTLGWTNIKIGEGKQPTRHYNIDDVVWWLSRSYAHFDGSFEKRLREIAQANTIKLEAA